MDGQGTEFKLTYSLRRYEINMDGSHMHKPLEHSYVDEKDEQKEPLFASSAQSAHSIAPRHHS